VGHRVKLRRFYHDTLAMLLPPAFEQELVKSRAAVVAIIDEVFLRLHDRYSEGHGTFALIPEDAFAANALCMLRAEGYEVISTSDTVEEM
jgi:hypothetical protein